MGIREHKILSMFLYSFILGLIILIVNGKFFFDRFPIGKDEATKDHLNIAYKYVDLPELLILSRAPQTLLIDIREKRFYSNGHIPGAINIDFRQQARKGEFSVIGELSDIESVVLYGNRRDLAFLHSLIPEVMKFTKSSLYIYDASWDQWIQCGLPIEN